MRLALFLMAVGMTWFSCPRLTRKNTGNITGGVYLNSPLFLFRNLDIN